MNQEHQDRSTLSVSKTLSVVHKLDKLFKGVALRKKYRKRSFKDLYAKQFNETDQQEMDYWLNACATSSSESSSSSYSSGDSGGL